MNLDADGLINTPILNYKLLTVDGKPLKFCLDGFEQSHYVRIAKVIEAFGGKLSNSYALDTITLSIPKKSSNLEHNRYYDVKFLADSIRNHKLQKLENYRIPTPVDRDLDSSVAKRQQTSVQIELQKDVDNALNESSETKFDNTPIATNTTAEKIKRAISTSSSSTSEIHSKNTEYCLANSNESIDSGDTSKDAESSQKEGSEVLKRNHTTLGQNINKQSNIDTLEDSGSEHSFNKENSTKSEVFIINFHKKSPKKHEFNSPRKVIRELEMPITIYATEDDNFSSGGNNRLLVTDLPTSQSTDGVSGFSSRLGDTMTRRTRYRRADLKPRRSGKRDGFSDEDECRMMQFLIEKNALNEGKRSKIWKDFLKNNILDRGKTSAAQLAAYFYRQVRPNCHRFTSDPKVLSQMKSNASSRINSWTKAECQILIDFLIKNNWIYRALSISVWKECLESSSLLQKHHRTPGGLYTKFRYDLRYNYSEYTNDSEALRQFKEMEHKGTPYRYAPKVYPFGIRYHQRLNVIQ